MIQKSAQTGIVPISSTSNQDSASNLSSAQRAYDEIKWMAITYQFRPGERINEVELAKKLNVSRTPVREALSRLVIEGFLTSRQNKGFYRRSLDAEQIMNLYELRCALEQQIVRLVCQRASVEEIRDLENFVKGTREEVEDERRAVELLRLDEEFHIRLAHLTKNNEIVRILEHVNSRIHFVRWIDAKARRAGLENHLALIKLLKKRDAEGCASLIASHISRRHDQIAEIIRNSIIEIYTETPQESLPRSRRE